MLDYAGVRASELAAPQQLPQPFPPQTEKELAYIEQLLTFWEQQSGKIQRYRLRALATAAPVVTTPADVAEAQV